MSSNYWDRAIRRSMDRRRFLAMAGSAGAAAALAACGGNDDSEDSGAEGAATAPRTAPSPEAVVAKLGGQLKVAIGGEPRGGFDPHLGFGGEEHQFDYLVYDQLIAYDSKGNLDKATSLAERWEVVDPTTIVLTLRQGIQYHDGTPFNAESVKWNLDRILDPANKATPGPDLAAIGSVTTPNSNQVQIKLKAPSAPLLTAFGDRGGMMLSRAALEKAGKDNYLRQPAGTGPFVLKKWVSQAEMTLERNPNYWRKDAAGSRFPYLDSIFFQFIPEDTVRTAALESGQVDLLPGTPAIEVARLNKDAKYQTTRFVGASTALFYINHAFPPFDNKAFRQAFATAIDAPTYIKNFLTGDEPVAGGLLPPSSWGHDSTIKGYAYDVQKAKQLLSSSGLSGSQLTVKLQPQGASLTQNEQFMEANLKAAGITVAWGRGEVGGSRLRVYIGQGGDGTQAGLWSGFSLRVDPDGVIGQFYTKSAPYNSGTAPVPEVEPLVLKATQTYDQAERKKLYSQIQSVALEQLYSCIPVVYTILTNHGSKNVRNLAELVGAEGKPRYGNLWLA